MLIAYSSNAFTKVRLSAALKSIAAMGFDGVEILCDLPHCFPGRVGATELEQIKISLCESNLAVSNLNANTATAYYSPSPAPNHFEPALTSPDPELRRWRQNYTIETIRLAASLKAPCISITSGTPSPDEKPDKLIERFVESLKPICEAAAKYDVKVGIEYEPGLVVEKAGDVMTVLEKTGSPELGVNLDIGHSFLNREPPAETVTMLAGRIWNVHVEDIKGNIHFHLVPGDGELPFSEYMNALIDSNYKGFLTLELYSYSDKPVAAGKQGLAYLSQLLAGSLNKNIPL